MVLRVTGIIWHWRGPSPHHFVTVPQSESEQLADEAARVTYGWGMIPVRARIGRTSWATSLFPKDGGYIVPIRASVRKEQQLNIGDTVEIELEVQGPDTRGHEGIKFAR